MVYYVVIIPISVSIWLLILKNLKNLNKDFIENKKLALKWSIIISKKIILNVTRKYGQEYSNKGKSYYDRRYNCIILLFWQ